MGLKERDPDQVIRVLKEFCQITVLDNDEV
jgi:hypothetical protein